MGKGGGMVSDGWMIDSILEFDEKRVYGEGYAHLGFHGPCGVQYVLAHWANWVGAFEPRGPDGKGHGLAWTAGAETVPDSPRHIPIRLEAPMYISGSPNGTVYVSCYVDRCVYKLEPEREAALVFFDGTDIGMKDMGNCLLDAAGCLWVNEVEGRRIWRFDPEGKLIERIGTATGMDEAKTALPHEMGFGDAVFGWIADIRLGPDGSIYILDSGRLAVWRADPSERRVVRIAGSGASGFSGDKGDALLARFGSDAAQRFGGPLSLSVSESRDVYIGDSVNGRVRMVDAADGTIDTIADGFVGICSMDYWEGRVFVPEERGRLTILKRN
jgi:hypothetical protein